ncbi:hypothetical protein [Thaumasiovibrio subtropicus]|uniref:hypothetical protein n=1 Tax=Thaumasiovibrio subtropicus TaxID=1891207 RepID=UPI000B34DC5E|nr:hypothetical protein [Thaumasiovibrio subtropicus]
MKGAGGTSGGIGSFFIGLVMMCGGFYMLLNSIVITNNFAMSTRLYSFNMMGQGLNVTGGMVLIPFMFGVGLIFFNSRNIIGWLLTIGSVSAFIFGVISSINFTMRSMSAFELMAILVMAVGGLGLFLRSLR